MEKSTARSQLSNFLKNNTWVSQVNWELRHGSILLPWTE
jgi:hypothetical protein